MKTCISVFVGIIVSLFHACAQKTFDEKLESLYRGSVPTISVENLEKRKQDVVILDTRAPEEFEVSHIEGAEFINYTKFSKKTVKDLPRDQEIVVYCSVGYRSERIGEKLLKMGFTDVKNLYGGIFNWKNRGRTVVNMRNQPTDSVHTYNSDWGRWLNRGTKVN